MIVVDKYFKQILFSLKVFLTNFFLSQINYQLLIIMVKKKCENKKLRLQIA